MPPIPKPKSTPADFIKLKKSKHCIACEGTGKSSRGGVCWPCQGKGTLK